MLAMKAMFLLWAVVVVIVEVEGFGRNYHKKMRGMNKKGKPILSSPALPLVRIHTL
jgi:hypothetical protein